MLINNVLGALSWIDSLHLDSVICGYHAYEDIRILFIGEIHCVQQEADNTKDCFAV